MESLYVHVPFCVGKCGYCDFYSERYDDTLARRYLNALEREISMYGEYLKEIRTVYIGGGTPSVFGEEYLDGLLNVISGYISANGSRTGASLRGSRPSCAGGEGARNGGVEFTVEVNPVTITGEKIEIFKKYGVNRVSLGVQSFSDGMLTLLGRAYDARQAKDAAALIRRNFDNSSIDLIYAVPGQGVKLWEETLLNVLDFSPPHISAYELTPEKGTPLYAGLKRGDIDMPDEDTILRMYETSSRLLKGGGYGHYEVSNYARPGYESLHNLNYWRRGEYIGIGPSAHSFFEGKRYNNVSDIMVYCEALEDGSRPSESVETVSAVDGIKELVFLGLRTDEGFDIERVLHAVRDNLNKDIDMEAFIDQLRHLFDRGLMDIDNGRLHPTEHGYPLSNSLITAVMRTLGV